MKKVILTAQCPATLPEGNVKAGESLTLPDMRAVELVNLSWAEPDGWEMGDIFTAVPMYASSQEPTKPAKKTDAATK